jgi:hypothetical protein
MFSQDDARALRQIRFAFARAQDWMESKAPAKRRTKGTRARLVAGA